MAKRITYTEAEQLEIARIQEAFGITRKSAIRKMRSANKKSKKAAKTPDFKSAAANDKTADTPVPTTDAGKVRSEGLRLYALAGRPTKAQFIRVYGKDGAKWTWEQRAKQAELASAEEAAKKFQSMLAAKAGNLSYIRSCYSLLAVWSPSTAPAGSTLQCGTQVWASLCDAHQDEKGPPPMSSTELSKHSSPTTDVVVDFQCGDCCFKVAGAFADVEIARRSHRHPNLFAVAMDRVERQRLRTKYFEQPLSPALADTTRLPKPYARFYVWGVILATLTVTAGGALFSRWAVDALYPTMGGWVHGSFMLLIVGGLLYALLRYENKRRAANLHRFRVVAECNHHIRNALQVLIFNHDGSIQRESLGISRRIGDAVRRIELTLSEVFPEVL